MDNTFKKEDNKHTSSSSSSGCCGGNISGNRRDADDGGVSSDEDTPWFFHKAAATPSLLLWGSSQQQKKRRTNVEEDDDDTKLAKEMNELSFQERERVLDDIHGVAPLHEEHPDEIKAGLEAMDIVLSLISKLKRKALDRALFLRPSIQDDVAFKLMFLRADLYDAHKAAHRMVQYFEQKQELFGADKVAKDITLDDLDETEKKFLSFIPSIILRERDPSGRPTFFCDMSKYDLDKPLSMYRCFWYQVMSELEDESVQMRGICVVSNNCTEGVVAPPSSVSKMTSVVSRASGMVQSLPVRIVSFHFCYDDGRLLYLASVVRVTFGKSVRLRFRTHFGSPVEVQYSLMTFGIDCSDLLGNSEGEDGHGRQLQRDYIDKRREMERKAATDRAKNESASGIIHHPGALDILVGRGRPYQEYCGNKWLARYIEDYAERISRCTERFEKTVVFMQIVKQIQKLNGRFIQRTPKGWTVVSDTVARIKIASGFRSTKSKLVRQQQGEGRQQTSIFGRGDSSPSDGE